MKKAVAMVMVVVMMLAFGVTAFAANGPLTVEQANLWQTRGRSFCLARAIEKLLLPHTPNFSFPISNFRFVPLNFSFLISHFSFLISHFPFKHCLRPVQPHPLSGPLYFPCACLQPVLQFL